MSMHYRPEIDGLRALAVLPVIFFHAGLSGFGGGFVGVDVFFVISGYLITGIIRAERETGRFSLASFYERRARRILPALYLVLAICIPVAWMVLLPRDFSDFAKSLIAVPLFASNVLFYKQAGYFEPDAELKPLLHTWSLGVEEQYYLFFPLLFLLLWRLGRRRAVTLALVLVAVASFALAQWASERKPDAAFFLLPTRAWELLIGALLSMWLGADGLQRVPAALREWGAALGIAMLGYAIATYDNDTPFPGVYALLPAIGTGLIILCARQDNLVGKLLAHKVLVGIGLISYSAYLWHQPLFAFARHWTLGEPAVLAYLALILATLALAWLSWRFVEGPFRQRSFLARRQLAYFSIGGALLLILAGWSGQLANGHEYRFPLSETVKQSFARTERVKTCFSLDAMEAVTPWTCNLGTSDATVPPTFFLVGDSHALTLYEVFDQAARQAGVRGTFAATNGCAPFLGIYFLRNDQKRLNCHELQERIFNYVRDHGIKRVILAGRWSLYTDGGYAGRRYSYLGLQRGDTRSQQTSRLAFAHGLQETVRRYAAIGVELHVIRQVPQQLHDPRAMFMRSLKRGELDQAQLDQLSVPLARHRELNAYANSVLDRYVPPPSLHSFDQYLCDADRCRVGTAEGSFYVDDDHISTYGSMRLLPHLQPLVTAK